MKVIKVIVLFVLCILLSGCNNNPNNKPTTANQNGSSDVNTPTEALTNASTAASDSDTYFSPDYSRHTVFDKSQYITDQVDLSVFKQDDPMIATQELTADWSFKTFQGFQTKDDIFGYDIRCCDISKEDLSIVKDFNDLSFDTDTVWPDILPDGFDPNQILEYNKNPGLGIRALHELGITGAGIGIAIIDQALLLSHEQYKDNLAFYEKIHCRDKSASMHGPAVASIAVGKDIGVAPGATLYFIAETHGHYSNSDFEFDASIIADSILRVLEINKCLPESNKIRVISISKGYSSSDMGYKEITDAIKKADEQNVFVITTSTQEYYKDFALFGMDRDYLDDPDDFNSYKTCFLDCK